MTLGIIPLALHPIQIIENGEEEEVTSIMEGSPVHEAAARGDLAQVSKLLKENPKAISARDVDFQTPLEKAVTAGQAEVVAWLLDTKKLPVDSSDSRGNTLLHMAAYEARPQTVRVLLVRYAKALARNKMGLRGRTPLDQVAFGQLKRKEDGRDVRKADVVATERLLKEAEAKASEAGRK